MFELFQKFRAVQVEARVNLLKRLKPEAHSQYRSQKYTWMGNRKQLIELFFTLMEKNWIHVDKNLSKELQCLPIIETFNIYENGDNVPLNEAAFNKAWKDFTSSNSSTRKQHTPVFENLNSLK